LAELSDDPERALRAATRSCGPCSHCCTVLRVEELAKPAGRDCVNQRGERGCSIHESRPAVCQGYRCLWLQGGLGDTERPDQTGGIVDLESAGFGVQLSIREIYEGAFDASPVLQAIAERYRNEMPVRITDAVDVMDPDRPFRVLLSGGEEQRVAGERVEFYRDGELVEERVQPWAERLGRRVSNLWRSRKLQRTMPPK
jgi:Fe-S-cluster containining protein